MLQTPLDADDMRNPLAFIAFAGLLQALCFMAGANSIFDGDKLLTTANNDRNEDLEMMDQLGLSSRPAFLPYIAGNTSTGDANSPF